MPPTMASCLLGTLICCGMSVSAAAARCAGEAQRAQLGPDRWAELWQRDLDLRAAWRDKKLTNHRDGNGQSTRFLCNKFWIRLPHVSSLKIFAMAWAPKQLEPRTRRGPGPIWPAGQKSAADARDNRRLFGPKRTVASSSVPPHSVETGMKTTKLQNTGVFLLLFALATFIRLPWFFQDVIDWDESVFILVGQGLAQGHLPYTVLWDDKPPLGFAFFSLALSMVPGSLAFIRFCGATVIAISAFLLFRISLKLMPIGHSVLSACLFIIAVTTLIQSGEAVMMEHIALLPLLAALLFTVSQRRSKSTFFAIGALLGAAALIRLNLAYVAAAATVATPLLIQSARPIDRLGPFVFMSLGGLLVLLCTYLPYGLTGHGALFVDSVFRVPFAYARSDLTYLRSAVEMVKDGLPSLRGFGLFSSPSAILSLVFWVFGGIGLFATIWFQWRVGLGAWLAVYAGAISYSVLATGHPWSHYLIQLAPLFALGVGGGLFLFWSSRVALGLVSTLAILSIAELWPTYHRFAERLLAGVNPYYGPVFDLANHLKQVAKPGETFFFDEDVLAYWLLHASPVAPIAASPSNICIANKILVPVFGPGMTTHALLEKILTRAPDRVVLKNMGFLCPVFDDGVRNCLLRDYEVEDNRFDRMVFRRKANTSARSLTNEPQTCFEAPGGNAP